MKIPRPINTQEEEERMLTFDQWQNQEDRVVMRGEKAVAFNEKGKALFVESQTEENSDDWQEDLRDGFGLFDSY